ncbi:MAG: hypothetical protein M3Y59_07650 [Myxococcota bacterium]|nr:hypothetical protein [Myxococcota bacterium]
MGTSSVVYSYDLLGRVLSAKSDTQDLFSYAYDNEGGTAPSGCATTYPSGELRVAGYWIL